MDMFSASSKDVDLVSSGRIICYNNDYILIKTKIGSKEKDELKIKFEFIYSGNDDPTSVSIGKLKNNKIDITLKNFGSPLGTGLIKPIPICRFNDRNIYILFYVYKNGNSLPILDFSIYLEQQHGKK